MGRRGVEAIEVLIILAIIGIFLALIIPAIMAVHRHNTEGVWLKASDNSDYKVLIIDECEYLEQGHQFSHRGNCRACLQRQGSLKAEKEPK